VNLDQHLVHAGRRLSDLFDPNHFGRAVPGPNGGLHTHVTPIAILPGGDGAAGPSVAARTARPGSSLPSEPRVAPRGTLERIRPG
jgi:hypothetical protein